ncbi:unnamed protein product [Ilex paraguariensis]|uniref:DUF4228 domain-containing protein n=1 Tax=Ilex paraguariensis TaxID=185542 RepID=A0ABC8UN04_9AQUA
MGCCFSCKASSTFSTIRVVHLNGYIEDFEHPVTVSEVTGNPPKHFVITQAELLSTGTKPLRPDAQLEPGHIYFLLPFSTFQSNVSPLDLAPIARKLTAIAKSSRSNANFVGASISPSPHALSPIWGSPATSPSRFSNRCMGVESQRSVTGCSMQKSSKTRSWTPLLATIRERSFNRRSKSDLREKNLDNIKIA